MKKIKRITKFSMLGIVVVVLAFFVAGYFGYPQRQEEPAVSLIGAEFLNNATDVVGTKTASSTPVGVAFGFDSADRYTTSTFVSKIGNATRAVYTIQATDASSTSEVRVSLEGSQDFACDTTATSTTDVACVGDDCVLITEIDWFDAGNHLKDKVHNTSFVNSSSTADLVWTNPVTDVGNQIILENLDFECLRLGISASSSILWAQISLK